MPGFYLPDDDEFDPKTDDFVTKYQTSQRDYLHFDLPLSEEARKSPYIISRNTSSRRFLPLLAYTVVTKKYAKDPCKIKLGKKSLKSVKIKRRPIKYASHADAAYLQAYAEYLNQFYEKSLIQDGSTNAVLAYRKGGATNIHHAKSLFEEIISHGDCHVFALDISSFFDSLNHSHLRQELLQLIGVMKLEGHHWDVFHNMARYAWVETEELDAVLGKKRERRGRICTPEDFKNHVRGRSGGLVKRNELKYGIPQGTPISGLYANIYLRTFDRKMMEQAEAWKGSYRRYSDDIAIVIPTAVEAHHVVPFVQKLLADFYLELSTGKTEAAEFCGGRLISAKPIQYLGFTFDGEKILIRDSSLDAYRSKMKHAIHAKLVSAKKKNVPSFKVYKRELLSKYTHKGKRRNFITYARNAERIMGSPDIRAQVARHIAWFNRALKREIVRVYGGLVTTA